MDGRAEVDGVSRSLARSRRVTRLSNGWRHAARGGLVGQVARRRGTPLTIDGSSAVEVNPLACTEPPSRIGSRYRICEAENTRLVFAATEHPYRQSGTAASRFQDGGAPRNSRIAVEGAWRLAAPHIDKVAECRCDDCFILNSRARIPPRTLTTAAGCRCIQAGPQRRMQELGTELARSAAGHGQTLELRNTKRLPWSDLKSPFRSRR